MNKFIFVAISCCIISNCSASPFFNEISLESKGKANIEKLHGKGDFYYFYARLSITDNEKNSGYQEYYKLLRQEAELHNICAKQFNIIKDSLSYYDEGGFVSVLLKCK